MLEAYTFCGYCGHKFMRTDWPRQCFECNSFTYRNPTPVSVLLLPVWASDAPDEMRRGILIGKRGHQPGLGLWGLPGGFLELGESFEEGCIRELQEETGLPVDPDSLVISHSRAASNGTQVLVFNEFVGTVTPSFVMKNWKPCNECPEVKIAYNPEELAFPTHTEALSNWFKKESL